MEPSKVQKAKWVGHKLVSFGTDACENCGNERLRHLHRIRFDDGREMNVGCVCAANLCDGQKAEIADAERQMTSQERRDKKLFDSEIFLISGGKTTVAELIKKSAIPKTYDDEL